MECNALHTTSVGGPFDTSVDLEIGTLADDEFSSLGTVPIGGSGWYEQTAGVCEFPADRALTAEELTDLGSQPIAVRRRGPDHASPVASEGADGVHVRTDDFVYRISANETVIAVAGPALSAIASLTCWNAMRLRTRVNGHSPTGVVLGYLSTEIDPLRGTAKNFASSPSGGVDVNTATPIAVRSSASAIDGGPAEETR